MIELRYDESWLYTYEMPDFIARAVGDDGRYLGLGEEQPQTSPPLESARGSATPPPGGPWMPYRARSPETGRIQDVRISPNYSINAWRYRARDLATFWQGQAVRTDACGAYRSLESRERNPDKGPSYTSKDHLDLDRLVRHFEGYATEHILGLHATARGDAGRTWSRFGAIDIDRHDEDTDPGANWRFAIHSYRRAIEAGFQPILEESNGKGGYHLWILFNAPVETEKVYDLLKWLAEDWADFGLTAEPETFPKQRILKTEYGNWIRMPGRHHTHLHWSMLWSGSGWLAGDDAIDLLLSTPRSSASLIPAECHALQKQGRGNGRRRPDRTATGPADGWTDARLAEDALQHLGQMARDYTSWLRVGMCLAELGEEGLAIWTRWSAQVPDKFSEEACREKWATFGSGRPEDVGLGRLFDLAKGAGWVRPTTPSRADKVDAEKVRARAEEAIDAGNFATFIIDDALFDDLAAIEGSGAMALIRAKVKGSRKQGFLLGEFDRRVKAARDRLKTSKKNAREGRRPSTVERPQEGEEEFEREVVSISTNEYAVNQRAVEILARATELFVRGTALVKIVRQPARAKERVRQPEGTPKIIPMSGQSLRELSTRYINWCRIDTSKEGEELEVPIHPPSWAIDAIMSRGEWPLFRPLEGVAESPVLRPDGTILDRPGWDRATCLYYEPSCEFPPVPDQPTRGDVAAAVATLLEIVQDFPFAVLRTKEG